MSKPAGGAGSGRGQTHREPGARAGASRGSLRSRSLGRNGEGRPRAAGVRESGRGCLETTGCAGRRVGRGAVVTAAVSLPAGKEPSQFGRRLGTESLLAHNGRIGLLGASVPLGRGRSPGRSTACDPRGALVGSVSRVVTLPGWPFIFTISRLPSLRPAVAWSWAGGGGKLCGFPCPSPPPPGDPVVSDNPCPPPAPEGALNQRP